MAQANVQLKFSKKSVYILSTLKESFDIEGFGNELERIVDRHVKKGSMKPDFGIIKSYLDGKEAAYISCVLQEKHSVCGLIYPVRIVHCLDIKDLNLFDKNISEKFTYNNKTLEEEELQTATEKLLSYLSTFIPGVPVSLLETENA